MSALPAVCTCLLQLKGLTFNHGHGLLAPRHAIGVTFMTIHNELHVQLLSDPAFEAACFIVHASCRISYMEYECDDRLDDART
jgi:hypothetical protein